MAAACEPTEPGVINGAPEPEQSVPAAAAAQDDISLSEAFEGALKLSQNVGLTKDGASEETTSREKLEQEDPVLHEQTACPPVGETSSSELKWEVGAPCQAVWSEDGLVYPATVVSMDGERCRVRFSGYGNEEDVDLSALRRPNAVLQTQNTQYWKPGSRCRAVFSEDGLVYPAKVLCVKGQRCRVRFDNYNNEEDHDINSLLNPDELYGPNQANTMQVKERSRNRSKSGRGAHEKKTGNQQRDEAEKPTHHSFSLFPPFPPPPPPPPQSGSGDPMSFIPPPPPPVWMFQGMESSSSASVETLSNILMLWYMCGFHTGSYVAQQLSRSTYKD